MIKEEYISVTEKDNILKDATATKEQKDKASACKVISDDSYAICDFINDLINKVEHARVSLI